MLRYQAAVWASSLVAAIGAMLCGYLNGSISGIIEMKGFQNTFNISSSDDDEEMNATSCIVRDENSRITAGFIVSIQSVGVMFGAVLATELSDRISRKYTLSLSGLFTAVGATIVGSSFHIWVLLLGRVVSGFAIGLVYSTVHVYIAEISPKKLRGLLVSLLNPAYNFGFLTAMSAKMGFAQFCLGWRLSSGSLGVLGIVYVLGMLALPHSPRWLAMKKNYNKCSKFKSKKNGSLILDNEAKLELLSGEEDEPQKPRQQRKITWTDFLQWKHIKRLLLVVPLYIFAPAIGGFVFFYPVTFFCVLEINTFIPVLMLGGIALAAAILSAAVIDKVWRYYCNRSLLFTWTWSTVGRKPILIGASVVNAILAVVLGTLLQVFGSHSNYIKYTAVGVTGTMMFSITFSWSIVPLVVSSEIFSTCVKGICNSIIALVHGAFSFAIVLVMPTLLGPLLQIHGFLYLTAAVNVVALTYIIFAIPETRGMSLEQVDELFSQSWLKRIGCKSLKV